MSSDCKNSSEYYIYHHKSVDHGGPYDHIGTLENSLCCHDINGWSVTLTPFEEISMEEWSSLLGSKTDLCPYCQIYAEQLEAVPELNEQTEDEQLPHGEVQPPVEGYHIDYREATQLNPDPRDHIVDGDESLCDYKVKVNAEKSLKPFDKVSNEEWALLLGKSSNLCYDCRKAAEWEGILPDTVPEEPEYVCPYCDETARKVTLSNFAYIYHGSRNSDEESRCSIFREEYEQWRRQPNA